MAFEQHSFFEVDGDRILFNIMLLNDDLSPMQGFEKKHYGLTNNPTLLDISDLGYIPPTGSLWDGEKFITNDENATKRKSGLICDFGKTVMAFLVNNECTGCMAWCNDVGDNTFIVAAAKSNPKIVWEIVER
ncbi:hypothetical protein EBU71_13740 [bacterium]|nr:hypothetical protein [Candidatus Elulimicrobium humile]